MVWQINCPEFVESSANVQAQNSVVTITEYYGKLLVSATVRTAKLLDTL